MPNTYELIASSTVGAGGASSIDFNSIPNTYTDLLVKLSGRSSTGYNAADFYLQFNGSASGYSGRYLMKDSSDPTPVSSTSQTSKFLLGLIPATQATANVFGSAEIYIPNYAGSTITNAGTITNDGGSINNYETITNNNIENIKPCKNSNYIMTYSPSSPEELDKIEYSRFKPLMYNSGREYYWNRKYLFEEGIRRNNDDMKEINKIQNGKRYVIPHWYHNILNKKNSTGQV